MTRLFLSLIAITFFSLQAQAKKDAGQNQCEAESIHAVRVFIEDIRRLGSAGEIQLIKQSNNGFIFYSILTSQNDSGLETFRLVADSENHCVVSNVALVDNAVAERINAEQKAKQPLPKAN